MSSEKIYIYHTNDIHSDLTFWPRIAQELREKRALREKNGEDVFVFDAGDAIDRVHPLTEATNGQAIIELLNEGKYDAVTIGNNEGITNSKKELNNLYQTANFYVILTNLFDLKTGCFPEWVTPYKVFKTKKDERIGVFGLTTPIYDAYERLGWKVTDPIKQTHKFYKEHGHEADFWILLSHLGIEEDRFISKLFPISLIIGAHTHHVLLAGERSAGSMLTGAGQFGNWLGEVVITRTHGALHVETAKLTNVENDLPAVHSEAETVEEYINQGHRLLKNKKIANLPNDLSANWSKQTKLTDVVLDALADFAKTDMAMINTGLFMGNLNKGIITADDLHRCLPHPLRVMRCKIKGRHLLQLRKEVQDINQKMINRPVHGFGFRGKVFGKLCLKGLDGHQPIDLQKEYELATIDYFSFLSFFDTLNTHSTQEVLYPDFLRKVVGDYLAKTYPLNN